jgi:thioredoxin reductase (NADPH)
MRIPTDAHTATTTDGIFAAGDCVDSRYRQGIVAAGMGSMAAIDAEKWLEGKK